MPPGSTCTPAEGLSTGSTVKGKAASPSRSPPFLLTSLASAATTTTASSGLRCLLAAAATCASVTRSSFRRYSSR